MSIRKEHLDVFDKSLSSLQENADLAKQLVLDKGSIEKKIETGFNLIGGLGQSYQGVQNVKTLLSKGTNTAKTATKALQEGKEQAKTTDTGNEETPTTEPDSNVARASSAENTEEPILPEEGPSQAIEETSFMSPEAEVSARATQGLASESPGLLDQLAPMREIMRQSATPLTNSEAQNAMMDFDPESNLADIGNLSSKGVTQTLSGVENTVGETTDALTSGIADVSNTISSAAGTAGEVAEGLAATAVSSLDIPVAGEVIALLAGVGSAIASAFAPKMPAPTITQTGADFSTTDEHSGASLSAY
jgi:hypothetical protein